MSDRVLPVLVVVASCLGLLLVVTLALSYALAAWDFPPEGWGDEEDDRPTEGNK